MLYLTCTMVSSVDFAHYAVSYAKDWVSMDCGSISDTVESIGFLWHCFFFLFFFFLFFSLFW